MIVGFDGKVCNAFCIGVSTGSNESKLPSTCVLFVFFLMPTEFRSWLRVFLPFFNRFIVSPGSHVLTSRFIPVKCFSTFYCESRICISMFY